MNLFDFDKFEKNDKSFLIGTDEAGRGPAAGGVWASAVCFYKDIDENLFEKLNDSKKLTSKTREYLYETIKQNSYYSIKMVDIKTIEKINILNASLLAMKMAVTEVIEQIENSDFQILVDGNKLIKDFNYNQKFIIKGDSKSASIAAASILAKVTRDRFMDEIDIQYPCYGWKKNKGYLTKSHIEAIQKFGVSPYHRMSFLKNIIIKEYEQMKLGV